MNGAIYPPPLDKLLALGKPPMEDWQDYLAEGFGPSHVPELIRMATDRSLLLPDTKELSLEMWGPVHAARVLGQLRAETAVEPLVRLLHDNEKFKDDWVSEEIPEVLGMIGQPAIPLLAARLADDKEPLWPRVGMVQAIKEIADRHPEARAECVGILAERLRHHRDQDVTLNTFLVVPLLELKAVEVLPTIEDAFSSGSVDEWVVNWESVREDLNLDPDYYPPGVVPWDARLIDEGEGADEEEESPLAPLGAMYDDPVPGYGGQTQAEKKKARTKKKQAAQSRRKNRKK